MQNRKFKHCEVPIISNGFLKSWLVAKSEKYLIVLVFLISVN